MAADQELCADRPAHTEGRYSLIPRHSTLGSLLLQRLFLRMLDSTGISTGVSTDNSTNSVLTKY